ncbi:MAG: hypothetical protein RSD88_07325 [Anaerovoracaceae bacterium]
MSNIYLSALAFKGLSNYLEKQGHNLILMEKSLHTYNDISHHPDIHMCQMELGGLVFFGNSALLGKSYPKNIIYNAASTGKYFIHNLSYTNKELLLVAQSMNMELINVPQGYTKCNMVIIDENSAITSDEGIAKACQNKLNILLIRPGHVDLPGFPYGFLGGASGRVGNTILFNGNLKAHPDYKRISTFIENLGLDIHFFPEYPLTDIGSIIEEVKIKL